MTGAFSKLRAVWEVGVAGWPVTGCRRGGVLNITATAWTASFHWWRSGNITRTQNVSEYMLVLALCLVGFVNEALRLRRLKTVQTVRYLQCVQLGQLILSSIHCDE